jgi:Domain of unknown function (DUF4282)
MVNLGRRSLRAFMLRRPRTLIRLHGPQSEASIDRRRRPVHCPVRCGGRRGATAIRSIQTGNIRIAPTSRGGPMFDLRDLFQWERFITPSIIKIFYWLAVGISVLAGLSGMITGLTLMAVHPLVGIFYILASLIGVLIGVIFARIIAEFVLIMFRINEHLGAIRQRGQM